MSEEPNQPKDIAGLYRTTLVPLRRYLARMLGFQAEWRTTNGHE